MSSRVLIVDDEPEWQEMFKDIFISLGCEADAVADIGSAKDLLRASTYQLLVLDIFLRPAQAPLNYQGFLDYMERAYPQVKVLATTGKPLAPDEAFALPRLGVVEFIYKPQIQLDKLRTLARRLLNINQVESSPILLLDRLSHLERLLQDGFETLGESATEITGLARAVIKLASADVGDCPRLFTLEQASPGKGVRQAVSVKYVLTLWCEYPGGQHAWAAATYKFSRPREWVQKIAPYGLLVSRVLRVVIPVTASLPGVLLADEDLKRVQHQLELMTAVASQLPNATVSASATDLTENRLTAEEGAGLRALRAVLLAEDRDRIFGDLRKVSTEGGDIVWVCPKHEEGLRSSAVPH